MKKISDFEKRLGCVIEDGAERLRFFSALESLAKNPQHLLRPHAWWKKELEKIPNEYKGLLYPGTPQYSLLNPTEKDKIKKDPLFWSGHYFLQEPFAAEVVDLLDPQPGE